MATTNAVGPHRGTAIGYVKESGEHQLDNASTHLKYFTLAGNNGDSVSGVNTGALKLEWMAEDGLIGGRWGVYLAGAVPDGPWYFVGDIEYTGKSIGTPPTFNSATTRKSTKTNTPVQFSLITVPNSILTAVDGGASIYLKFVPRDGQKMVLTASELTYSS